MHGGFKMSNHANRLRGYFLSFYVLPKTQAIAVAVLHVEVAATIGLVTNVARDSYVLRLELGIERVGVFDPNVCVPGSALRIHCAVGTHDASSLELSQHDDNTVAPNHAETRWIAPEAVIVEA